MDAPGFNRLSAAGLHLPDTFEASGNYSAALFSDARGYVYFPEMRAAHDLAPRDRKEILKKARWIVRNGGVGRRFRDGIAEDLVGSLTPQPTTLDADWNAEALAMFQDLCYAPLVFDVAGEENFLKRQETLIKLLLQDGDCALGLSYTSAGNPTTVLYQSPQVATPRGKTQRDGWVDGVKMERGRRIALNLRDEELREDALQLEAADFIYFGDPEPGAPRGVSKFAPFVDRMLDVRELDTDTIRGIKAANLVGFVVTNGLLQTAQQQALMERLVNAQEFGGSSPTAPKRPIKMEEITRYHGGMVELNLGQGLETVHDERPHPNRQEFISYLLRDFSWGTGFPTEVLWELGRLTGPGVRFMLKAGEKAAKRYRRILRDRFCQRAWVWFVSSMMDQGRLRRCKDRQFWKCEWLEPEPMFIDTRDITTGIQEIEAGCNTRAAWYGEVQQDWRAQLRQLAIEHAEAARLEKEFGLPSGTIIGKAQAQREPSPRQ
ncbi:MAG: phage portal protein [Verrucomicrobiales bacterium]|nr:phage portal protein [Verrucomicrobiales bacterium]